MEKRAVGLACIVIFALTTGAIIVGALVGGWALSVLWGWFIVPIFNLPILPILYAIGLGLLVQLLLHRVTQDIYSLNNDTKKASSGYIKPEWEKIIGEQISHIILIPIALVFFGWIVHLFIK